MKVTVVPAQVTTVEDRIVGNLGFSQLLLLVTPVFGGSLLFMVLPPPTHNAPYKLIVLTTLTFFFWLLAIRIRGKILLLWLVIILRYNLRPSHYVFDKNNLSSRDQYKDVLVKEPAVEKVKSTAKQVAHTPLDIADSVRAMDIINNPAAKVRFETTRKGKLYVHITEIKEQG